MIRGYLIKFFSFLLCFSGAVLLSGCCHYFDISRDEYLRSDDHSDAKLILDTNQEIIIDEEEDLRISPGYDSVFVTTDTLNYSINTNNIVSVSQNRTDWVATPIFSVAILFVTLSVVMFILWGGFPDAV